MFYTPLHFSCHLDQCSAAHWLSFLSWICHPCLCCCDYVLFPQLFFHSWPINFFSIPEHHDYSFNRYSLRAYRYLRHRGLLWGYIDELKPLCFLTHGTNNVVGQNWHFSNIRRNTWLHRKTDVLSNNRAKLHGTVSNYNREIWQKYLIPGWRNDGGMWCGREHGD